jgi:hypothetical protein
MKIIAALAAPVLALGGSVLATSPASAHTPGISADCNGVHVGATAYDSSMQNRWSVTIAGVTRSGTFGSSFDQTFPVPQDGTTVAWSAYVEAEDGSYHGDGSGTVGPCGTPPVVDVCDDLPGAQPEGTACTPPPDVQRAEEDALAGCDVSLEGRDYGAGDLSWVDEYTDTYVFDDQTGTWVLVTDTTPTVTHVEFTPWTVQEQVDHGCRAKPEQPPAEHTRDSNTRLDCDDDVLVTTTVTTTTPYVYDEGTNAWVPGQPVTHESTKESPVQPGRCRHHGVSPTHAHSSPGPQVTPVSSTTSQVPTVVDAGLTTAPAGTAATAPVAAPVRGPDGSRMPALLLLPGVLLLAFGALRLRRS